MSKAEFMLDAFLCPILDCSQVYRVIQISEPNKRLRIFRLREKNLSHEPNEIGGKSNLVQ